MQVATFHGQFPLGSKSENQILLKNS